ncbi:hypothetical protein CLROS_012390 [Clostridium felsineum]|uniref:Uncharacterized protein n=2 Tax=Clostridium felsineum TaxID=36839 RepID=A0A1S8LWP3_9CLOT|nr:hypothetical protein CLROS_012390 [Clostridium felsineum]URZ10944.1 hypothetical protein CROST_016600 [Clostridium felsineum]
MKEDILMYQNTTFAKTKNNEEIIHVIKTFEDLRMSLYKLAEEKIQFLSVNPETYELAEKLKKELEIKYEIECNNERIKIVVYDYLPSIYIKTTNKGTGYFTEKWKNTISKAIRSLGSIKTVNEVFVYIKMYAPLGGIFDADNKYFKPIFDGIGRSGLVPDDCIKYIKSFGFEVEMDKKNPHTEIYIYFNDMGKKISDLIK